MKPFPDFPKYMLYNEKHISHRHPYVCDMSTQVNIIQTIIQARHVFTYVPINSITFEMLCGSLRQRRALNAHFTLLYNLQFMH